MTLWEYKILNNKNEYKIKFKWTWMDYPEISSPIALITTLSNITAERACFGFADNNFLWHCFASWFGGRACIIKNSSLSQPISTQHLLMCVSWSCVKCGMLNKFSGWYSYLLLRWHYYWIMLPQKHHLKDIKYLLHSHFFPLFFSLAPAS